MNKELLRRIRQIFETRLQSKTGWGRNELLVVYDLAVNEALMEAFDAIIQDGKKREG